MIYVLLPAFNEEAAIGPTISDLGRTAAEWEQIHVILVDDGSSDATIARATEAAHAVAVPLTVLRHAQNQGLGAGIRTGVGAFLEHAVPGDILVSLDADSTHRASQMPALVSKVRAGADVAIASRYVPGASITGVPWHRRILSDCGRLVFRVAFPIRGVRDYTCGYRAYAYEPLLRAHLVYGDQLCTQRGFEATVDLLLRLRQVGITAAEVPLELDYSVRAGQSKMRVARTIRSSLGLAMRRFVERFTVYSPRGVQALLERRPTDT